MKIARSLIVATLVCLAPGTALRAAPEPEQIIFWFMGASTGTVSAVYASSGPLPSQVIPLAISTTDQNVENYFVVSSTHFWNAPGANADWAIWGVSSPRVVWEPLATFEAESGLLGPGWAIAGGALTQDASGNSGSIRITFVAPEAGDYLIKGLVRGPDPASNSFLMNVDAEPTSPTMIWDVYPPTAAFETRPVQWRGNATEEAPQHSPKWFTLASGPHTIVIRGREAGAGIDKVFVDRAVLSWDVVGDSVTMTAAGLPMDDVPPGPPRNLQVR